MIKIKFLVVLFLFLSRCFAQENEFSITSFGVSGSDKNDDTQLFDKAIEHIAIKGGILYIPAGEYILDQKVRQRRGVNNTSYIFLVQKDFIIKMHKNAKLIFKNAFKGFRFRSTQDPNKNTISKLNIIVQGGKIDASLNNNYMNTNNPEIWAFVGEYFKSFTVTDLSIENLYGTAGIASYNNTNFTALNNMLINVTGNPNDYTDNHGDGIYVSNTSNYTIRNNQIKNSQRRHNRLGRIGVCIEYEQSKNGIIDGNEVSGYDRGIHIELIKGTATIINNKLEANLSGIVLWNNYKFKQIIKNNIISNIGLEITIKPILYTNSPILLLEYNSNNGTEIFDNDIVLYSEYFLPKDIMQITSSNIKIKGNNFLDYSKSLSISVSQGRNANERVTKIQFKNNNVSAKQFMAYDGSDLDIQNNNLDIEEVILSFDNSENIYKGNTLKQHNGRKPKVRLHGKYN